MRFSEIYHSSKPALSFEFFPPKEESELPQTLVMMGELAALHPHFMTVTYGAGGSKRGLTDQMVTHIHKELRITAVQHLTCAGHSVEEIDEIVDGLLSEGVTHILALRGDPPKGESAFRAHPSGFGCARDLARHLAARGTVSLAIAGYPEVHKEASSAESDLRYLKEKCDAGGEVIFTQLFFDNQLYLRFCENARKIGITAPIVPGIMPISNVKQLERFTALCGASIPDSLRTDLMKLDPADVIQFGIEYAVRQCEELLREGAPGIHLYTLNRSLQTVPIVRALGIS